MPGLDVIAMTGLLALAANPVQCDVPRAPLVTVTPSSSAIRYDNSKSLAELSHFKADTISPYDRHTEQLMFGLHHGKMNLSAKTMIGYGVYNRLDLACFYFDRVEVELALDPVIYIVSELKPGSCAYRAVQEHEKKHVAVDREIANKYAHEIGKAVQAAIDRAGALGPYPTAEIENIQTRMTDHVGSAVASVELLMTEEQQRRQQEVDSLEEYNRVSDIIQKDCRFRIEKEMKGSLNAMKKERK